MTLLFHGRCHGRATGCTCPGCQATERRLEQLRVDCPTCRGITHACNDRADDSRCQAFTAAGKLRKTAQPAPAQPWEPGRAVA